MQTKTGEKRLIFTPGLVFLVLGILIGGLFSIVIPYGAGFDEEQHLVRIYDISGYNLLPNHNPPYYNSTLTFKNFFDFSYQRRYFQSPAYDQFETVNFNEKVGGSEEDYLYGFQTRSIYSPVIFFPQALVAKVFWRSLDLPLIPGVMLARLAGLLVYIAAGYVTIRLLPIGKWVFAILALAPSALFQAATLNADGYTSAFSFLLIGLTLNTYAQAERPVRPWQAWALAACAVLLGLGKPGAVALLPLLLILVGRPFQSKALAAVVIAGSLAAVAANIGWTVLTVPNSHFGSEGSQDIARQLSIILPDIGNFLVAYLNGVIASMGSFILNWIGAYGYWVGYVPQPVYWFFLLALPAALLAEARDPRFSWKSRGYLLLVFLAASGAILFLYFYLHYSAGETSVLGRQGRYFAPTAPLLFIALAGLVSIRARWQKLAGALAVGLYLVSIGFYSLGLYAAYYTDCGYSTLMGGACEMPIYKNLDKYNPPTYPINDATQISQSFTSLCGEVSSVGVLVSAVPQLEAGALRYSLLDSRGTMLASQDFPLDRLTADETLTLRLNAPVSSGDGRYQMLFEALDVPTQDGIQLGARTGDLYPEGDLYVDGSPVEADLIFRYNCPNPRDQ